MTYSIYHRKSGRIVSSGLSLINALSVLNLLPYRHYCLAAE